LGTIIQLDESVTVRSIEPLCDMILRAFEQGSAVDIDVSAVVEADLSLVQLIEAARGHAARENKAICLTEPANSAMAQLLHRAGFLSEPTTEDIAFWCHGVLPQ
jgi:ABC-type transporter Mla MlaB component